MQARVFIPQNLANMNFFCSVRTEGNRVYRLAEFSCGTSARTGEEQDGALRRCIVILIHVSPRPKIAAVARTKEQGSGPSHCQCLLQIKAYQTSRGHVRGDGRNLNCSEDNKHGSPLSQAN